MEGSCTGLILASRPNLHQRTQVLESGISYHQLIIYTMLKSTYTKSEPTVVRKRQYKNCSKESFLKDLKFALSNDVIFSHFNNEFKDVLDHHVPIKQIKLLE